MDKGNQDQTAQARTHSGVLARLNNVSLTVKVVGMTMLSIALVVTVSYVSFVVKFRGEMMSEMTEQAAAFTAVADEAKANASRQMMDGSIDKEELGAELAEAMASGKGYQGTRLYKSIPVVVGWTAAQNAAEREGLTFRTPAFDARNPGNEPEAGSFRAELLNELTKQVDAGGPEWIAKVNEDTNTFNYMRAIRLDDSCMSCHGDPEKFDIPDEAGNIDGLDPVGFAMEGWEPGYMHGAYEIEMPLAPVDAQVASFIGRGMAVTVPLVAVTGLAFVFVLRRSVSRPLAKLIDTAREIAATKNLTKRINFNRKDEIGKVAGSFDELVGSIHSVVGEVTKSSESVAAAGTEIAASAEEMASTLSNQEASSGQVASAITEMAASVSEVANRSLEAAQNAETAGEQANSGGEIVRQTVAEMIRIRDDVTLAASQVDDLAGRASGISEVLSVISDIADQTNLLALNAAIEAARAGEHGRGFAVVADEVRKLAERTQQATQEVSDSINAIQGGTKSTVEMIQACNERVGKGSSLAENAGSALEQIVAGAKTVQAAISDISAATQQQSTASEEVTRSMDEISSGTRESSIAAQQAAEAASKLSKESERLRAIVAEFTI